jgi:hypothetical protein
MFYAISSGFLVGLLGSFHCIGMCGPIALALPIHQQNTVQKILSLLTYNLGRIITYSFLGLIFGLIGKTLFIGKYQQVFSIVIGSIILLFLLIPFIGKKLNQGTILSKYHRMIQQQLSSLFKKEKNILNLFIIGIFNGLLPCGLVYMAIAGSLSTGNINHAILFMLSFGLGTVPIMFSVAFFGNYISQSIRKKINKAVPFVIGCMAVLLIVRGMNLGIPYISPKFEQTVNGTTTTCCHKE